MNQTQGTRPSARPARTSSRTSSGSARPGVSRCGSSPFASASLARRTLTSAVHRTLQGGRRVDADDLVAFAAVLGVTPAHLLAPPSRAEVIPAVGPTPLSAKWPASPTASGRCSRPRVTRWLAGRLKRALQKVRLEVAEVLEESAARPGKAG